MFELIASCAALVASLFALWVAGHCWLHAPGARLWAELRLRIEALEWENEQRARLHHRAARQENVHKATEARVAKQAERRNLLDDAQAVLDAAGKATAGDGHQLQLVSPVGGVAAGPARSEAAELARLRKLAGI